MAERRPDLAAPVGRERSVRPSRPLPGSVPAELVRVTVTGAGRRCDLALPSRVPLAELVPHLGQLLGRPGDLPCDGWSLLGPDGRLLGSDSGLGAQGVGDGEVLVLLPGSEVAALEGGGRAAQVVHDDVVDAVAEAVSTLGPRWGEKSAVVAARAAAGLLAALLLAVVLTSTLRDPRAPSPDAVALAVAVALVATGIRLSRVPGRRGLSLAALLTATPYAAVAGLGLGVGLGVGGDPWVGAGPGGPGPGASWAGWPAGGAGIGVLVTVLVGLLAPDTRHWLLLTPVPLGAAGVSVGTAVVLADADPSVVAAGLVVVAVVLARFAPGLGLASTGSALTPPLGDPSDPVPFAPIVLGPVLRSVRRVHELTLAVTTGAAVLVTVAAPLLVGLGWAGCGVAVASGLVTVLRTRQLVLRADVVVGVVGAAAILLSVTVSVLWLRSEWAPWLLSATCAGGALALGVTVRPPRGSVRARQLLDLVEGLALGSLLPLLVVATGLLTGLRGIGR